MNDFPSSYHRFIFFIKHIALYYINVQHHMKDSLSYHTNRGVEFTVCFKEVNLATDNIFVNSGNKIYEHIYVSRKEPSE